MSTCLTFSNCQIKTKINKLHSFCLRPARKCMSLYFHWIEKKIIKNRKKTPFRLHSVYVTRNKIPSTVYSTILIRPLHIFRQFRYGSLRNKYYINLACSHTSRFHFRYGSIHTFSPIFIPPSFHIFISHRRFSTTVHISYQCPSGTSSTVSHSSTPQLTVSAYPFHNLI